jgi:predicted Zn-dependent protease
MAILAANAGNPALAEALRTLAVVARRQGSRSEALEHFRAAAACAPGDVWIRSEIVAELTELGRLDEAEAAARALAEASPDLPAGWRALSELARRRGKAEEALAHMRQAAAVAPQDLWIAVSVAGSLRELRRFAEAEAYARELVARHPASAVALTTLAQCSRWRLTSGETLALFERAVAAEPVNDHARLTLAAEYAALWRLDEAERIYDAILAANGAQIQALIGKAQLARRRGDRDKSFELLDAAATLEPDNEWVIVEYARELVDAGRVQDAERALGVLIECNPHRPGALVFLGQTARANSEPEKARRYFATATGLAGANETAVVELALEEYRAGAPDIARRRLEDLLARRPDCVRAHDVLGDIAQLLHDVDAAYEARRAALALDDSSFWRRLSLARLETAMGRHEEAHNIIEDCEARFGVLPEIALAQAQLANSVGDPEAELTRLTGARKAFPTHFEVWAQWVRALTEDGDFETARLAVDAPPPCSVRERARARFLRGQIARAQRRHGEAAADFAAALQALPGDSWLHDAAAKNALTLADVEAAVRHMEVVTRGDPTHRSWHAGGVKPLQTHVGQLLDEYRLDAEALARLRAANAADDPVAALQRLVAERPDYTPGAIGLFIALSRQGRLTRPAGGETSPIPRRIAQYWDERIPPDIERLCEEWRTRNPDFHYRRFSSADARRYLAAHGPPGARAAFDLAVEPAMKADLFRLAVLRHEGGFYVDADDRGLKPLAEIDPGGCDLVLYLEDFGSIGNNFIGAIPRHPAIALALAEATAAILRGDADLLWLSTGPGLLTRSLARWLAGDPAEALARVRIFDRHELHRAIAMHCASSYKQSGKHWGRAAFGKKLRAASSRVRS